MLKMFKRNRKGFTLTELIVVIAILGVLAAVVTPSVMGYLSQAKDNADKANAATLDGTVKRLLASGVLNLNTSTYADISAAKAAIVTIVNKEVNPIPAVNDTTKHFVLTRVVSSGICTSASVTLGTGTEGADVVFLD